MDEREFELVNILGKELDRNQRDLSQLMNLSLGQTNMLIRRLVSKGYIRMSQLNKRKVQYLLTPKGIAEKLRKSMKYALNTINSISLIKDNVKEILIRLKKEGHANFFIYGESDLSFIVEKAFDEAKLNGAVIQRINKLPEEKVEGVILIAKENVDTHHDNINCYVNLIKEIARDGVLHF